jgi:hypothetical protein
MIADPAPTISYHRTTIRSDRPNAPMRSLSVAILLLPILATAAIAAEPAQLSATARAIEASEGKPPQLLTSEPKAVATPSVAPEEESVIAAPVTRPAVAARTAPLQKPLRHRVRRTARYRTPRHYVSTAGGIVIEVASQLEPGQLTQQLQLYLEGRRVANFDLDSLHPQGALRIALPGPGRLRYQLRGITDSDPRGQLAVDTRGCIDILPGGRYALRSNGGRGIQLQPFILSR